MADFLVGANLPWLEYGQDFGASAWRPRGGVARPETRERLRRELGRLADAGARLVRWWLLGDGRAGVVESPSGRRLALDDCLLDDFDAALDALDEAGLRAVFVVLDFLWFAPSRLVAGVQTGGRRPLVADRGCRDELLASVISPLASRHPARATIAAWDLMNEPEWATLAVGTLDPWHSLSRRQMRGFLGELARAFRAAARQPLTVGLASARWLSLVEGVDLDFDQVHWYEKLDSVRTLREPRRHARIAPPRPLLLGEFATRGSTLEAAEVVAIARSAGYTGALAWSLLATDRATDGRACLAALGDAAAQPQLRA